CSVHNPGRPGQQRLPEFRTVGEIDTQFVTHDQSPPRRAPNGRFARGSVRADGALNLLVLPPLPAGRSLVPQLPLGHEAWTSPAAGLASRRFRRSGTARATDTIPLPRATAGESLLAQSGPGAGHKCDPPA